jgi:UDP-N-acetylmuramyl-tripeptide synthetase
MPWMCLYGNRLSVREQNISESDMEEKQYYTINEFIVTLQRQGMLLDSNVGADEPGLNNIGDSPVSGLTYNSKEAEPGTLFVCKGETFKQEYLQEAFDRGAICYVSETPYPVYPAADKTAGESDSTAQRVPAIIVKNVREAMPVLAAKYYRRPWENLKVTGVGGTKGKSTSVYYMKAIVDDYMASIGGKESAVISSIEMYDGKERYESHITTPEAMELQRHMRNAVDSGIEYLQMEVSSQALKYNRVDEIRLDVGVYMNISEDHISPIEHSSFDDYFTSKMKMFAMTDTAIINMDSDHADIVLEHARTSARRVITFAVTGERICAEEMKLDFCAYDVKKKGLGTDFKVKYAGTVPGIPDAFDEQFELTMPGFFNVENALGVIAAAVCLEIPIEYIKSGIRRARSSGRMETTISRDGKVIAIVDYAHNKLSFEKLYGSTVMEYPGCSIVGIFGCPGGKAFNRREELALIAGEVAEKLYLVPEDPGPEEPEEISRQIAEHVKKTGCPYEIIDNRGDAIRKAIFEDCSNDKKVLLITGKGDETRQKIGKEYIDCESDTSFVARFMEEYDEKI